MQGVGPMATLVKIEAAGDRTQDQQIKSLLLYQLSYGL